MTHTLKYYLKHFLFYLGGDQPTVSWVERLRSVLVAFLGLMLLLTIAKYLGELTGLDEWLMATLGASALLVFALPRSPMAQPWAVIAGYANGRQSIDFRNVHITLPASLAAAVALIVVLGHVTHYQYAFFPVMIDSAVLVMAGAIYSNLTGKRYPNRPTKV